MVRTSLARLVLVLSSALSIVAASPTPDTPQKRWLNFGYGLGQKVRGVDLGGWFVLEPYINLSLFRQFESSGNIPVDEYHFTQYLGQAEALAQLQTHWDTWITQDDFTQMAAAGLNHVRIPIGYWAFQLGAGDPYVQGQIPYLERALGWARAANIKVWIDLHGAPGSQNGFDNSGLRDSYNWQTDYNLALTNSVLDQIIATYSAFEWNDVIVAIQPVNEPLGTIMNMDLVRQYYQYAYSTLRGNSDIVLAIHDAFQSPPAWNGFMTYPDYTHVILDTHQYQVFSAGELSRDVDTHIAVACGVGAMIAEVELWTVVGEWSAALTDCAEWLNGVNRGARYDGSYDSSPFYGSCETRWDFSTWSDTDKMNSRRYVEAQLDAYEHNSQGWIFWCWKTENAIEWDFKALLANGIMPSPLTDRQYPGQCGY
ncbi:glycoside hydrolase superfamily [Limtongia smithiae]|uniref:glycoside hydrolase superfamily n=1 Tax=Limtongia smithiae TaxID=1125753 RepID=UPI0034CF4793